MKLSGIYNIYRSRGIRKLVIPVGITPSERVKEIGINTRNWVDSAENRDYWRALVNAALNLRVL